MLINKTVLFISPVFYGYEKLICTELKGQGATVIFYPERNNDLQYKFFSNFKKGKLAEHQKRYYLSVFNKVKKLNIDYVFIIRGFLMPLEFITAIRNTFPNAYLIMHQWDSMNNNNYKKFLHVFDSIFSFDPIDCSNYPILKYLPNFYHPQYADQSNSTSLYDLSFIGWGYLERINFITKIKKQLPQLIFFYYLYIPFTTYIKNLLKRTYLKSIKFITLSPQKVVEIIKQSKCVLDIPDDQQAGYTFRTIDAMAAHKKLITTNKFIKHESFYNENNILIINKTEPAIDNTFFKKPFADVDISEYSLSNWIKKIFSIHNRTVENA